MSARLTAAQRHMLDALSNIGGAADGWDEFFDYDDWSNAGALALANHKRVADALARKGYIEIGKRIAITEQGRAALASLAKEPK